MKECSKCNIERDISMFYKDKYSPDGHRTNCKECSKKYREESKELSKAYRERNKESHQKRNSEYQKMNKEIISIKKREYYLKNKESILDKRKQYYEDNRETKMKYQRDYQQNNKEKRNKYLQERRESDPLFKLTTNVRNLINNSFYENGYTKSSRTQEILGCSYSEFKKYLEYKFEYWMDWGNRGIYDGELCSGWDIDHITPLSICENVEELLKLNHYTNLQPLCSKTNRDIKKNNLIY